MSRLVHTNKLEKVSNAIAALREPEHTMFALTEKQLDFNNTWEESGLYILKQNQFYPKAVREFQISPTVEAEISAVHNAVAGHHGVQATFDKLMRNGKHWSFMREHIIKYFIKKCCPFCQKMSYFRSPIQTNLSRPLRTHRSSIRIGTLSVRSLSLRGK